MGMLYRADEPSQWAARYGNGKVYLPGEPNQPVVTYNSEGGFHLPGDKQEHGYVKEGKVYNMGDPNSPIGHYGEGEIYNTGKPSNPVATYKEDSEGEDELGAAAAYWYFRHKKKF
ncbi:hypothetical protein ACFU7T_39730 [Streptomyces sp. NPDC057555]|uniref:hypothetical protein n=1 Tax=Streptomyces sp. NPDC057555 TaxID=3346166 RepID=UPI0036ACF6CC